MCLNLELKKLGDKTYMTDRLGITCSLTLSIKLNSRDSVTLGHNLNRRRSTLEVETLISNYTFEFYFLI